MVKLVDLTQLLVHNDTLMNHPDHPRPLILQHATHAKDGYQTDMLVINTHNGTHVDAPCHVDPDSKSATIEQVPLERWYGTAICLDLSKVPQKGTATVSHLKDALREANLEIRKGDIVLINFGHESRTRWTRAYCTDFPGLGREASEWLAERGVKLLGTDTPTPESAEDSDRGLLTVHDVMRERDMLLIENLGGLDQVSGKRFLFMGFPLNLKGCSGSLIRAVALLDA